MTQADPTNNDIPMTSITPCFRLDSIVRPDPGEAGAGGAGLGFTKSADKKSDPCRTPVSPFVLRGEPTQMEFMMANDLR